MEVLPAKEKPGRKHVEESHRSSKVWLIAIIAFLLIALAAVLYFVLRDRTGGTPASTNPGGGKASSTTPTGPRQWFVAKTKLDGIDFTSINEALKQAGPGDTIVITDKQVYQETLNLTASTSSRGFSSITIQGEISDDGKRAKLAPPRTHPPAMPLVSVENVNSLKITGLLLDGEDAVQTALQVKGSCPGLILEDVRIEGFQQRGIVVENLTGTGRREAQFNKLFIKNGGSQPAQAAILTQGSQCDGLQIRQCRLQGLYATTISFGAPIQRLLMEQCKLYGGKGVAVQWSDAISPNQRMNATFQQNTFWDFATGMSIEVPVNASDVYFSVRNNLFYQVKSLLNLDAAKTKMKPDALSGGWAGSGNVFDAQGSQPGVALQVPKFGCKALQFTLNTSPTPPQDFLRIPAGSPLATAGERNDPVGATD